ncbi:OprD family outer membrane porin [Pseudomonas sp.]|uniref:OprD family outer membrane porin n=1 Tax=Pseudomonas sp. TaxID=306 RepID=UPI0032421F77
MRYTPIAGAMAASLLGLVQPALAGGFVEDSKATLDTRNFYINQDNRSGDAAPSYAEEWGQGFLLNFQSGYTDGPVGVGLDALAQLGIRLDSGGRTTKAGRSRNPGSVFPLDSDGSAVNEFSRIDFAAKARVADTELR